MLKELSDNVEVYLITDYTNMRKGIDGLVAMIQGRFLLNPFEKCLFLFCGRNKHKNKSFASSEILIHVIYEKYMKGVPLERIAKEFKSLGLEISTATLANWVIEACNQYLMPIYDALHEELLKSEIIHADETVVQVLNEKERKATTKSRMWVYCNERIKLYEYKPTRSGQNAVEFLEGFNGYLVCDGYDGYNKLKNVHRCGCFAHARRKFLEAIPTDAEIAKTSRAKEGFDRINKIYALERKLKELPPEERQKQRL